MFGLASCCCVVRVCFTVTGCQKLGVPTSYWDAPSGTTVTLKQGGVTKYTGTIDGYTHSICFDVVPGTYDVTIAPPAGSLYTSTILLAQLYTADTTVSLHLGSDQAANYYCTHRCGCEGEDTGPAPWYHQPIPDTLTLTIDSGAITLSRDLVHPSPARWTGCQTLACRKLYTTCGPDCTTGVATGAGSTTIFFELSCSGTYPSDVWTIGIHAEACELPFSCGPCVGTYPLAGGGCGGSGAFACNMGAEVASQVGTGTCSPMDLEFTYPGTSSDTGMGSCFTNGGESWTVTA